MQIHTVQSDLKNIGLLGFHFLSQKCRTIEPQVTNIQDVQVYRLDNKISSLDHIIFANDVFEKLPSFQ